MAVTVWVSYFIARAAAVDDPTTHENESWDVDEERTMLIMFGAMTTVFIVLIAWRCRLWYSLVKGGVEVPGMILGLGQTMHHGVSLVTVSYTLEGREITSSKPIGGLLPKFGRNIAVDQEVSIFVNPRRPDRYIVLDLIMKTL